MKSLTIVALAGVAWFCPSVSAQSLFERVSDPANMPSDDPARTATPAADGAPSLAQVSVSYVAPPEPVSYEVNDLVTIIISERTQTERSATLETEKEFDASGELIETLDLLELLELRLQAGRDSTDDLPSFGLEFGSEFEGEGEYERDDSVTARVTARVIDVYPNGTLMLESRTVVTTDGEEQVILLSGVCREQDITVFNTVQSNQMYDLRLSIQNSGQLRKASEKGLIPRIVDTLFNF